MRPNKSKVYIVRLTIGGDKLDAYQYDRSPAVSILDAKSISNSQKIPGYCMADIKVNFLCSKMEI